MNPSVLIAHFQLMASLVSSVPLFLSPKHNILKPIPDKHSFLCKISVCSLQGPLLSLIFFLAVYVLRKPGCLPCRISHNLDLLIDSSRCNLTCSFVPCIVCKLLVRSTDLIKFRLVGCYFGYLSFFQEQIILFNVIRKHLMSGCLFV